MGSSHRIGLRYISIPVREREKVVKECPEGSLQFVEPWDSLFPSVIQFVEPWEKVCPEGSLQYEEPWENVCPEGSLQYEEPWES